MALNGALGQTQVFYQPAPAVAGDFASTNTNRFVVLAGPGGLVAGAAGLTVGLFAWLAANQIDTDNSPTSQQFRRRPAGGLRSPRAAGPDHGLPRRRDYGRTRWIPGHAS